MFLLPRTVHACPFCGSRSLVGLTIVVGLYLVQCTRCGGQGPHRRTPESALLRWNHRNTPEPLVCTWCLEWFQPLDDADAQYCSPLCRETADDAGRRQVRPVRHRTLRALAG
jgi:hypothetical protein